MEWFRARLSQAIETIEDHYSKFRISDALMTIYKLFWDDYCSWYLEAIKPAYGEAIDKVTYDNTLSFFESLLKLVHPVMPFISEELWQDIGERAEGDTIMYAPSPKAEPYDPAILVNFAIAEESINGVRSVRQQKNIPPKEPLALKVKGDFPVRLIPVIAKLANTSSVEVVADFGEGGSGVSFLVGTLEMFVPLGGLVNVDEEIAKLEKDLAYQKNFLENVRRKLANEAFTVHAPAAVVENERKKEADALSRVESLTSQLNALKNSK